MDYSILMMLTREDVEYLVPQLGLQKMLMKGLSDTLCLEVQEVLLF